MLLSSRQFLVKERVAILKLTDTYDIHNPQTNAQIGTARDEPPGWAKALRLLMKKHFLPTTIRVYQSDGSPALLSLRKKPGILHTTVILEDMNARPLGSFKSKLFSLGGGFLVHDAQGNQFAEVTGDWKGWNFRFLDSGGRELGVVTKKWGGIGKELLTTADNYVISLNDCVAAGGDQAALLLSAGLAIDIVFKER